MNYSRIYFNLIKKAKTQTVFGYTEAHHIIPVSLGGKDLSSNLVALTTRQHFIAHALLLKMAQKRHAQFKTAKSKKAFSSMYKAFSVMKTSSANHSNRYFNSRLFEVVRNRYYEESRRFTSQQLQAFFDFYLAHNCFFQGGFARLKKAFDLDLTQRQFSKLLLNNGFSIKEAVASKRPALLQSMFDDYVSNHCATNNDAYIQLQTKYHYPLSKEALVQLFNLNGLYLTETTKVAECDVKAMFDYYLNFTMNGESFEVFQAKFNYTKNASCLKHLFRTKGLSLAQAEKEKNLLKYREIYTFYLEHGVKATEQKYGIKKDTMQCAFSTLGISKRKTYDKTFFAKIKAFYVKHQCQKAENYHLIAESFDYTAGKSTLLKQFAKHGL